MWRLATDRERTLGLIYVLRLVDGGDHVVGGGVGGMVVVDGAGVVGAENGVAEGSSREGDLCPSRVSPANQML